MRRWPSTVLLSHPNLEARGGRTPPHSFEEVIYFGRGNTFLFLLPKHSSKYDETLA